MSMEVFAVCRLETAIGFTLAGIATQVVRDSSAAVTEVMRLCDERDVGVILIEDTLYDDFPERVARVLRHRATPIVVPFPSPSWTERPETSDYVLELLRQAIGYRVRLR